MTGEINSSDRPAGPNVAKSDKETRGFSKRIILVFIVGVGALIAMITMQTQFGVTDNSSRERERNYRAPQPSGFVELAAGLRRDRILVQGAWPSEAPELPRRESERRMVVEVPNRANMERDAPSLPRYYSDRNAAQAANMLRTMKLQALTAQPVVEGFELQRNDAVNAVQGDGRLPTSPQAGVAPSVMDSSMLAALMGQAGQIQQSDPNRQGEKIDFLRSSGGSLTPQGYSANLPIPQQFPYELKAGTIIPGIMLTGINSDLPGNVIAQVSENVWDTATGRHVLIPKGTRILGVYDSQVTFGQRRVLLVWNRLIFPNGTTLDISGSPGVDQAGYSGLSGRVNEHWER